MNNHPIELVTITVTRTQQRNLQFALNESCKSIEALGNGTSKSFDQLVRIVDQAPHGLTDADLSNLRTACWTSSMRTEQKWREAYDALANKLDALRTEVERHVA